MTHEERKTHNKKQYVVSALVLLVGGAIMFLIFGKDIFKREAPPVAEAEQPTTYTLEQTVQSEELEFFGNLKANKESQLSAKASGRVQIINVDEGDPVRKGQLVAMLYPDQAGIDYRKQSQVYDDFEDFRSEQEDYWERQVEIAEKNLDIAKEEEEFSKKNDPNNLDIAEERVERAEEELESAKQERDAQEESLKQQSDSLRGDRDISGQNLVDTRITAPFDGVVIKKVSEEGEVTNLAVGDRILTVADLSSYKVTIEVPDSYIYRLSTGLKAKVVLDGIPGEHTATITLIKPRVDPIAKKIEVELTLDVVPQNVKVDMFARVLIKFPPRTAYFVPNIFIFSGFEGPYVELEDGTKKRIQRGSEKDGMTEIAFEGITKGITIIR